MHKFALVEQLKKENEELKYLLEEFKQISPNQLIDLSLEEIRKRKRILVIYLDKYMKQICNKDIGIDKEFYQSSKWPARPNSTSRLLIGNYLALKKLEKEYMFHHIVPDEYENLNFNDYDVIILNQVACQHSYSYVKRFINDFMNQGIKTKIIFGTEVTWLNQLKKDVFEQKDIDFIYKNNTLLRHTLKTDRHIYQDNSFLSSNIIEFELGIDTEVVDYKDNIIERKYITFVEAPADRVTKNNQRIYEIIELINQDKLLSDKLEIKILKPPYSSTEFWNIMEQTYFFIFTSNSETFSFVLNDARAKGAICYYPEYMYYTNIQETFIIENYPQGGIKYSENIHIIKSMNSFLNDKSKSKIMSKQTADFINNTFSLEKVSENWSFVIDEKIYKNSLLFLNGNSLSKKEVIEYCKKHKIKYVVSYLNKLELYEWEGHITYFDADNDLLYIRYFIDEIEDEKYLAFSREPYLHYKKGTKKIEIEEELNIAAYFHAWTRVLKVNTIYVDNKALKENTALMKGLELLTIYTQLSVLDISINDV